MQPETPQNPASTPPPTTHQPQPAAGITPNQPNTETQNPQDHWFIPTAAAPQAIATAARSAARRGSLPGYNEPTNNSELFTITDFGSPFESRLTITPTTKPQPGIELKTAVKPLMPVIAIIVLVLTVYPGVYLSDMFIREFFPGTLAARTVWWWHIGLSAPFFPFAFLSAWKKSQTTGRNEAAKHTETIKKLIQPLDPQSNPG